MKHVLIFLTIFSSLVFSNTNIRDQISSTFELKSRNNRAQIRAQTTLRCLDSENRPKSFEFRLTLWEIDYYPREDDIIVRTFGRAYGNITVVSKGTPEIDHFSDEKYFWIWSWITHNCTISGQTTCSHVDLGKVNPEITGVNFAYTVNLHNQNVDNCDDDYRYL